MANKYDFSRLRQNLGTSDYDFSEIRTRLSQAGALGNRTVEAPVVKNTAPSVFENKNPYQTPSYFNQTYKAPEQGPRDLQEKLSGPTKGAIPDESFGKSLARKVLPASLEEKLGLNKPKSIKDTFNEQESAKEVYRREVRRIETLKQSGVDIRNLPASEPAKDAGFFGEFKKGFKQSYLQGMSGLGGTLELSAGTVNNIELMRAGERIADRYRAKVIKSPELNAPQGLTFQEGGWKNASWYGRTIGELVPSITLPIVAGIVGGIVGGPAGATAGAYSGIFATESGSAYNDMIDKGINPKDARTASVAYGSIAAYLEGINLLKIGKKFLPDPTKKIIVDSVKKSLLEETISTGGKFLTTVAVESGTEGTQQFAQNFLTKWLDNNQDLMDGVIESAAKGAVGGTLFGGVDVMSPTTGEKSPGANTNVPPKEEALPTEVPVETVPAPIDFTGVREAIGLPQVEQTTQVTEPITEQSSEEYNATKQNVIEELTNAKPETTVTDLVWIPQELRKTPIIESVIENIKTNTLPQTEEGKAILDIINRHIEETVGQPTIGDAIMSAAKESKDIVSDKQMKLKSPKHAWLLAEFDKLIKVESLLPEHRELLKDVFYYIPKNNLVMNKIGYSSNLPSAGQSSVYARSTTNRPHSEMMSKITLEKGLGKRNSQNNKTYNYPVRDAFKVFLHEFGHLAQRYVLTVQEEQLIKDVYDSKPKEYWTKYFKEGFNMTEENSSYYASNFKEFFVETFAQYVITSRVPDSKLTSLYNKVSKIFKEAVAKLRARPTDASIKSKLEPLFEKILGNQENVINSDLEAIKQAEAAKAYEKLLQDAYNKQAKIKTVPIGLSMEKVEDTKPLVSEPPKFDPETEKRYQAAKKVTTPAENTRFGKIKSNLYGFWIGLQREHKYLPQTAEFSKLVDALRQLSDKKSISTDRAVRILKTILHTLDKNEYDAFSRKLLIDDLYSEVSLNPSYKLPLGLTKESLFKSKEELDNWVYQNKNVGEAIATRNTFMTSLQSDLVANGILNPEQIKENYFHHQVLQYAVERNKIFGTGSRLKKTKGGYSRQRVGSELDIMTDYLQAEFEMIGQALLDVDIAKVVDTVDKSEHNIRDRVRDLLKNVVKEVQAQMEYVASGQMTKPDISAIEKFRIEKPKTHAEHSLNESLDIMKSDIERGALSKKWQDYAPQGYQLWQSRQGSIFYHVFTIPERIAHSAMESMVNSMGVEINPNMIGNAMAVGGPREEMLLRDEVAETLNNLRSIPETTAGKEFIKEITKGWKIYTLFNPRRAIRYNIQNMIGDLDAVMAGSPGSIKFFKQATEELYQVFYGEKVMSGPMADYFERGGLSSNLTDQEISEGLSSMKIFKNFYNQVEKRGLDSIKKAPGYFATVKTASAFRENIARYATYLYAIDKQSKGESIGYGASDPAMLDEITDPRDKAAKWSRELVGDYGALSETGRNLRETWLPFFSWLEINFKRYPRLMKNAFYSDGITGVGKIAGSTGLKVGVNASIMLVRMASMYAIAALWNNLAFPDEEKELSDFDKGKMHINLGRTADGDVRLLRLQGAFGDWLSWFGLEALPAEINQFVDGQLDFKDIAKNRIKAPINKLILAVNPLFKGSAELITKKQFFPDIFNPIAMKDQGRYLASQVSMENEYDMLQTKPSKGYLNSWKNMIITSYDPNENVYNSVVSLKYKFKERVLGQKGSGGGVESVKTEAYRNYKKAVKYQDERAQQKYLDELSGMGVKQSDLRQALESADPMSGLSSANQRKFIEWLNGFQKLQLEQANKYYEETFKNPTIR